MKGCDIKLKTSAGVNKSDYYSDTLLDYLTPFLKQRRQKVESVLKIGTGRGYVSILIAKTFPGIKRIVATDIDTAAVSLAKENVKINGLEKVIIVRKGNLFGPVKSEKFDLIISVPPQLPITRTGVKKFIPRVDTYHLTTSVGGKTGRDMIDRLIDGARDNIRNNGVVSFVHSDMAGVEESLLRFTKQGFKTKIVGTRKKLLNETTFTRTVRLIIESKGYRFARDRKGRNFFTLAVIVGIYAK